MLVPCSNKLTETLENIMLSKCTVLLYMYGFVGFECELPKGSGRKWPQKHKKTRDKWRLHTVVVYSYLPREKKQM